MLNPLPMLRRAPVVVALLVFLTACTTTPTPPPVVASPTLSPPPPSATIAPPPPPPATESPAPLAPTPTTGPRAVTPPGDGLAALALRIEPERSLVPGDLVTVTVAATDASSGAPLAGYRLMTALNGEWNFRTTATTDARGEAQMLVVLADSPRSSCCVGAGGLRFRGSDYLLPVVFFGDATYRRQTVVGMVKVVHDPAGRGLGEQPELTSVVLEGLQPRTLSAGATLTATGRLLDGEGEPLAEQELRLQALGRTATCTTDGEGRCAFELDASGRAPGAYAVQLEFEGHKDPRPLGGSIANGAVVVLDGPSQPRPPALIYWGFDDANANPNDPANAKRAPFGGMVAFPWQVAVTGQASDELAISETVATYLRAAAGMTITMPDGRQRPKPIILGISPTQGTEDVAPPRLRELVGGSYSVVGAGNACAPVPLPRYDHPEYGGWYTATAQALRRFYDEHPELHEVLVGVRIMAGVDGEFGNMVKNTRDCNYEQAAERLIPRRTWDSFRSRMVRAYQEAFAGTPVAVYLEGFAAPEGRELSPMVGNKLNNVEAVTFGGSLTYRSTMPWVGPWGLAQRWPEYPSGYESKYMPYFMAGAEDPAQDPRGAERSMGGTLWMLWYMLGLDPDFVNFHPEHWPAFDANPWLAPFVNGHLGQRCDTTPSVWAVLRDVYPDLAKEQNEGWISDVYGDYSFCLYRPELADARSEVVTGDDLPEPARHQMWTNPFRSVRDQATDLVTTSPAPTGRRTVDDFFLFDIDDSFPFAGADPASFGGWRIRLVYLDAGRDRLSIDYKTLGGDTRAIEIVKEGSDRWVDATFEAPDLYAGNLWPGEGDVRINARGDGAETVVFVQLIPLPNTE